MNAQTSPPCPPLEFQFQLDLYGAGDNSGNNLRITKCLRAGKLVIIISLTTYPHDTHDSIERRIDLVSKAVRRMWATHPEQIHRLNTVSVLERKEE